MSAVMKRAMALLDGTRVVSEVAKLAFCGMNNLSYQLKRQHEAGNIHIAAWKTTAGRLGRCYKAGPGEDVPKPPPTKNTQRWRKFMESMTAYERDVYLERRRTNNRKVKPDPLVQQFFGGER